MSMITGLRIGSDDSVLWSCCGSRGYSKGFFLCDIWTGDHGVEGAHSNATWLCSSLMLELTDGLLLTLGITIEPSGT